MTELQRIKKIAIEQEKKLKELGNLLHRLGFEHEVEKLRIFLDINKI